jgi:hypothetical protein
LAAGETPLLAKKDELAEHWWAYLESFE